MSISKKNEKQQTNATPYHTQIGPSGEDTFPPHCHCQVSISNVTKETDLSGKDAKGYTHYRNEGLELEKTIQKDWDGPQTSNEVQILIQEG